MDSKASMPALPRAAYIKGNITPDYGIYGVVLYHIGFDRELRHNERKAALRAILALQNMERIGAVSLSPDGSTIIVGASDWTPGDTPFSAYAMLYALFRPKLPYCGVLVWAKEMRELLCRIDFAVAGIAQNRYHDLCHRLGELLEVQSARANPDGLTFSLEMHGELGTKEERQRLNSSLRKCGILIDIHASGRIKLPGMT